MKRTDQRYAEPERVSARTADEAPAGCRKAPNAHDLTTRYFLRMRIKLSDRVLADLGPGQTPLDR